MNSPEILAEKTQVKLPQVAMQIQTPHKRTSRSLIVILLFVFPPLAWFFMMADKTYHHWLIKVLFLSGIITLCLLLLFYFVIGIQITELYDLLGLQHALDIEILRGSMLAGAVFAVLQIAFALYCHQYLKHHGELHHFQLVIITILFVSALAIAILPPIMTIFAIYTLTVSI